MEKDIKVKNILMEVISVEEFGMENFKNKMKIGKSYLKDNI